MYLRKFCYNQIGFEALHILMYRTANLAMPEAGTNERKSEPGVLGGIGQYDWHKVFFCFRMFLTEPQKWVGYNFLRNRTRPKIIAVPARTPSKPGDFVCVGEGAGI
jgi:hypothetical protein